jgi:hypothetical protein
VAEGAMPVLELTGHAGQVTIRATSPAPRQSWQRLGNVIESHAAGGFLFAQTIGYI